MLGAVRGILICVGAAILFAGGFGIFLIPSALVVGTIDGGDGGDSLILAILAAVALGPIGGVFFFFQWIEPLCQRIDRLLGIEGKRSTD